MSLTSLFSGFIFYFYFFQNFVKVCGSKASRSWSAFNKQMRIFARKLNLFTCNFCHNKTRSNGHVGALRNIPLVTSWGYGAASLSLLLLLSRLCILTPMDLLMIRSPCWHPTLHLSCPCSLPSFPCSQIIFRLTALFTGRIYGPRTRPVEHR